MLQGASPLYCQLHTCIAHTIACSIQRLVRITNGYATAFFSTIYPTNHHASVLFRLWKPLTANSDLLVCCRLTHLIPPASLPGSIHFRASSNFSAVLMAMAPGAGGCKTAAKHGAASAAQVCARLLYNVHTTRSPNSGCSCSFMIQDYK